MNYRTQTSIITSIGKYQQASRLLLALMILDWITPIVTFGFGKYIVTVKSINKSPYQPEPFQRNLFNVTGNHFTTTSSVKKGIPTIHHNNVKNIIQLQQATENKNETPQTELNVPKENILQSSGNEEVLYDRDKESENDMDPGNGPSSPEFSSFESVSTDNMVNPFTGDFTYNLPLLEVPGAHNGGYAVALTYNNVTNPDEEASWVGFGWNLNPGAINRMKRGFFDEANGEQVEYINNTPRNWTVSLAPRVGFEAFSFKLPIDFSLNFRYNNYKGFGGGFGLAVDLFGLASLDYTHEDGKSSFSPNVNVSKIMGKLKGAYKSQLGKERKSTDPEKNKLFGKINSNKAVVGTKNAINRAKNSKVVQIAKMFNSGSGSQDFHSFSDLGAPSNVAEFDGSSTTFQLELAIDPALVPAGLNGGFTGSYSEQNSIPSRMRKAYGYIYSDKAYTDENHHENYVMDYMVEHEAPFTIRNNYNPVPFSQADYFSVSGEGVGGGFRAYWNKPGMFFPTPSSSSTTILKAGLQVHIPTDVGVGGDLAIGLQSCTMNPDWEEGLNGNSNNRNFHIDGGEDEPYFFRMNNDLGGYVKYPDNYAIPTPVTHDASITGLSQIEVAKNKLDLDGIPAKINANIDGSSRSGRATFINHYTNDVIAHHISGGGTSNNIPNLHLDSFVNAKYIDRANSAIKDHIGVFSLTNESGVNYVYALPVYNRMETNLQYNLKGSFEKTGIIHTTIDENGVRTGEINHYSYPASYLLTSIRNPDYADINDNGDVDDGDLGGYTKFDYEMAYGNKDKSITSAGWFRWRSPYTGLRLSQGTLHDLDDEMGSYSSGEKEVYYTKSIETKTHLAVFITNMSDYTSFYGPEAKGDQVTRLDAYSAISDDGVAASDPTAHGNQPLRKLEKIILYAKERKAGSPDCDPTYNYKIIKTVKFEYDDYKVWPGTPGNFSSLSGNTGKLTLKKVWIENYDVVPALKSPYEFKYEYPGNASAKYVHAGNPQYADIAAFYNHFTLSDQTPSYADGVNVDRWGNYQLNGKYRKDRMNPYVDQTPDETPTKHFDPAAWNLKQVILPTNAEIHMQYEQKDYAYVQNEIATAMMSFKTETNLPAGEQIGPNSDKINKFKINLSDFYKDGLTTNQRDDYIKFLKRYFNSKEYIYFKFLYNLQGESLPILPLNTGSGCTAEYIDGYVNVRDIIPDGDGIIIELGRNGNLQPTKATPIQANPFNGQDYIFPRYVCYDYIQTETGWQAGSCDLTGNFSKGMAATSAIEMISLAVKKFQNQINAITKGQNTVCAYINPDLSYFKLPVMPLRDTLPGKKGGGLRMKRLLMYDPGMEGPGTINADRSLYGTEYIYEDEDGVSTGVAANEPPGEGREENALVNFIKSKDPQNWAQKVLSGEDKEQFEGPYGESLLPSASVGYSQVITKSIHSGKTDAGFSVQQFYTSKDFPTLSEIPSYGEKGNYVAPFRFSPLDPIIPKAKTRGFSTSNFGISVTRNKAYSTQGYCFIINSMNGQKKLEAKYTGVNSNKLVPSKNTPVYTKNYEYFNPGQLVPACKSIFGPITNQPLGIETEIISERKNVTDFTIHEGLSVDGTISVTPPPIPGIGASFSYAFSHLTTNMLTMTKVVNLPSIPSKTIETKDGVMHITENLAFNQYTGNPMITKSYDVYNGLKLDYKPTPYDGTFYSYTQPACGEYLGMNQKAINEKLAITGLSGQIVNHPNENYKTITFTSNVLDNTQLIDKAKFSEGDLLQLEGTSPYSGNYFFYISGVIKEMLTATTYKYTVYVEPFHPTNPSGTVITYNPFTFSSVNILRSGKANFLDDPAGNITTYQEMRRRIKPLDDIIYNKRLEIIKSIKDAKISNSPFQPWVNIYNSDPNKSFKGGTGQCLTCNCPTSPKGYNTPCPYMLGCVNINNELYLLIEDINYAKTPYSPPSVAGSPLDSNAHHFSLFKKYNCKVGTKPLLINFQKLGYPGGIFELDSITKYKVYYIPPPPHAEERVEVKILDWCNPAMREDSIENVISNDASTFRQAWDSKKLVDYNPITNCADVVSNSFGINNSGKFRLKQSYVYTEPRTVSNPFSPSTDTTKVYRTGNYKLKFFGWKYPPGSTEWIRSSEITSYSPDGDPVEQIDAIDIPSTSVYTSDKTMPSIVASNADHNSVYFESFENAGYPFFDINHDANLSHSGNNSVHLTFVNTSYATFHLPIQITKRFKEEPILIKFWASNKPDYKDPLSNNNSFLSFTSIELRLNYSIPIIANKINSSGAWSLFEAKILPSQLLAIPIGTNVPLIFDVQNYTSTWTGGNFNSGAGSPEIYIDDIRIQPESSSMTCYVFDLKSKLMLAQFDPNHFGLYYLYNNEGKLTHKLVETERGQKMLEERQYNNAKKE